ncbi:MAG: hypothetical protein WCJ92_08180 [Alphaproteobacteria bacterium]
MKKLFVVFLTMILGFNIKAASKDEDVVASALVDLAGAKKPRVDEGPLAITMAITIEQIDQSLTTSNWKLPPASGDAASLSIEKSSAGEALTGEALPLFPSELPAFHVMEGLSEILHDSFLNLEQKVKLLFQNAIYFEKLHQKDNARLFYEQVVGIMAGQPDHLITPKCISCRGHSYFALGRSHDARQDFESPKYKKHLENIMEEAFAEWRSSLHSGGNPEAPKNKRK